MTHWTRTFRATRVMQRRAAQIAARKFPEGLRFQARHPSEEVLVSKSTTRAGWWRATWFYEGEPCGHSERLTIREAYETAILDYEAVLPWIPESAASVADETNEPKSWGAGRIEGPFRNLKYG